MTTTISANADWPHDAG